MVERGSISVIRERLYISKTIKYTMEVISIRIPRELKKSMKEIEINWSEEIRKFIEKKVREYKRVKALEEIDAMLANLPKAEKETAKNYVREDRDSN